MAEPIEYSTVLPSSGCTKVFLVLDPAFSTDHFADSIRPEIALAVSAPPLLAFAFTPDTSQNKACLKISS
jgi:hypothetical protein